MNPEKRLQNLLAFFGWQGGTIHQIAKETGIDASTLLYSQTEGKGHAYTIGRNAMQTATLDSRLKYAQGWKGHLEFWLGVAEAI